MAVPLGVAPSAVGLPRAFYLTDRSAPGVIWVAQRNVRRTARLDQNDRYTFTPREMDFILAENGFAK